jgi:hypothetical protein
MRAAHRNLVIAGSVAGLAIGLGVLAPAQAGHTNGVLEADLSGRAEVRTDAADQRIAGDPNGSGEGYVFAIDGDPSTFCYVLVVDRIEDGAPGPGSPFAAHIHRGAAGQNGPVVANLAFPQGGQSADCLTQDEPGKFVNGGTVAEILASPGEFYINVHTAEYPGGALRGQLQPQH